MTTTVCPTCHAIQYWSWEEAFYKFGFGDGLVMTGVVVKALKAGGYKTKSEPWGIHNVVIVSIVKDGIEQIPDNAKIGYDDPRDYLPAAIVALLDRALPDDAEVRP